VNKHEYISQITEVVASKATCNRAMVGAVFVNDDYEILSTGYNGAPRGMNHCGGDDHLMDNGHCVRTVHAEMNAIVQAAKRGTALRGSILYCTHTPCFICAKLLINLGVKEIRAREFFKDEKAIKWLILARIPIIMWNEVKV
jgi:dCMP deaminase